MYRDVYGQKYSSRIVPALDRTLFYVLEDLRSEEISVLRKAISLCMTPVSLLGNYLTRNNGTFHKDDEKT